MSKEESRGKPFTDSEMEEWEESHDKNKLFNHLFARAYEMAFQIRWKAFVFIAITTVLGVLVAHV
jgi:hypothetical protein